MPRNRKRTTAKAAWSEEDLLHAKAAIERGMSKRRAAKEHNIPFSASFFFLLPSKNSDKLIDERGQTPVAFADIASTPTIPQSSKTVQRRKRQHATILTETPLKAILEEKEAKKMLKTKGDEKNDKKKAKIKSKNMTRKSYKRKVLQESSSVDEENHPKLCNDDSNDDMDDIDFENNNKCNICKEFGRNNEMWYRCTACGQWSHAMCSGWDSANGYICDLCA